MAPRSSAQEDQLLLVAERAGGEPIEVDAGGRERSRVGAVIPEDRVGAGQEVAIREHRDPPAKGIEDLEPGEPAGRQFELDRGAPRERVRAILEQAEAPDRSRRRCPARGRRARARREAAWRMASRAGWSTGGRDRVHAWASPFAPAAGARGGRARSRADDPQVPTMSSEVTPGTSVTRVQLSSSTRPVTRILGSRHRVTIRFLARETAVRAVRA